VVIKVFLASKSGASRYTEEKRLMMDGEEGEMK
jgi:hypothetical protein